jgi:hypothetical protein
MLLENNDANVTKQSEFPEKYVFGRILFVRTAHFLKATGNRLFAGNTAFRIRLNFFARQLTAW